MKTYARHPLSSIFPKMSDERFRELIDDIDANGLLDPIVLYEDMILDGWHRYQACQELNVKKPRMVEYDGDDPAGFASSKNLNRRDITASERAMAVAGLLNWVETSGRPSRSLQNLKTIQQKGANIVQLIDEKPLKINGGVVQNQEKKTVKEAAALAGVSEQTMKSAKKVTQKGIEELRQAVIDGEMPVHEAAKIADKPAEEQKKILQEPKKKAESKPRETVPLDVYQALQDQYEELQERYTEMAHELEMAQKELEAVDSIRKGEQAKTLMSAYAQLRSMTEARDQWQNKCAEMTKQLNMMTKKK